jgi:hypothetical protein
MASVLIGYYCFEFLNKKRRLLYKGEPLPLNGWYGVLLEIQEEYSANFVNQLQVLISKIGVTGVNFVLEHSDSEVIELLIFYNGLNPSLESTKHIFEYLNESGVSVEWIQQPVKELHNHSLVDW